MRYADTSSAAACSGPRKQTPQPYAQRLEIILEQRCRSPRIANIDAVGREHRDSMAGIMERKVVTLQIPDEQSNFQLANVGFLDTVSAQLCVTSASIDADPVTIAATVFAAAPADPTTLGRGLMNGSPRTGRSGTLSGYLPSSPGRPPLRTGGPGGR